MDARQPVRDDADTTVGGEDAVAKRVAEARTDGSASRPFDERSDNPWQENALAPTEPDGPSNTDVRDQDQHAVSVRDEPREATHDRDGRDNRADAPKPDVWRPTAAEAWRRVQMNRPVVLLAGGYLDGVADALAALGAEAVSSAVADEVSFLVPGCRAVVVDAASTMTARWGQALASSRARRGAPPVVLVASLVDRSALRRNEARRFVAEARPAVIRGTIAELAALVGVDPELGIGHVAAASMAQVAAHRTGAVAIVWAEGEVATSDARTMRSAVQTGTPAQIRIAAQAVDAAVAATLACGAELLAGVRAAMALIEAAIERVSDREVGPGDFKAGLLNVLAGSADVDDDRSRLISGDPGRVALGPRALGHTFESPSTDELSERGISVQSMAAAIANRVEGGRVVPGSVPIHLLRSDPPTDATDLRTRWARTSVIEVVAEFTDANDESVTYDSVVSRARAATNELGASAVLLGVGGLSDPTALRIVRGVTDAVGERFGVAVRNRVDIAVAAGASAVWLSDTVGSLPTEAVVAVAIGRVVVIAPVASIDDAVAAVRAGAGALALTEGSGVDPHSLADIAPVALAMSPTHRHEIDGARNDADSQRQPDDAGTLRDR